MMDTLTQVTSTFRMTHEQLFWSLATTDSRYRRKSRTTTTPATREQWERYNAARAGLAALEAYEGASFGYMEDAIKIRRPKDATDIEYLETHDEWMARCRSLYGKINDGAAA